MSKNEFIPQSTKRVELHTNKRVKEKIDKRTFDNIKKYIDANHDTLSRRLKQLNREWDTERILETNAAGFILISTFLGCFVDLNWFILTGVISFFYYNMQYKVGVHLYQLLDD